MFKKLFFLLIVFSFLSCNNEPKDTLAMISTDFGDIKIKLYKDTPLHQENFSKLVKEGFYDGTLFHRIIPGFMIQGGDPNSKNAKPGQMLGNGGPGYTIPAEIGKLHFKGAISAARMGDKANPERNSSGSQFFIVEGMKVTKELLDNFENRNGIVYTDAQRERYIKEGGRPDLDGLYSVFGEVLEGNDIVSKIASQPKGRFDRPTNDISMKIKLID